MLFVASAWVVVHQLPEGEAEAQPVPVRSQQVRLGLLDAANTQLSTTAVNTDSNGVAAVPNNAAATHVAVTDRFGNTASSPIN